MVVKQAKHGVRSGNTFKASNSIYRRQYQRQALLVRNVRTEGRRGIADSYLKTDHVRSNLVPYSLNKKGRWSLPEILKQSILDGEGLCEGLGVRLVELHKVRRNANCISVCSSRDLGSSRGGNSKVRQKRHGYLNVQSVVNTNKHGLTRRQLRDRRRRGLPVEENHENGENREQSVITYEVIYPCPATSSLSHNPEYIGYDTRKQFVWRGYHDGRGKQRDIRRTENLIRESIESMTDFEYDSAEDDDLSYSDDEVSDHKRHGMLLLEEVLKQAQAAKETSSNRTRTRKSSGHTSESESNSKKGHVVRETANTPSDYSTTTVTAAPFPKSPRSEHISVILPVKQVDPRTLIQYYGNRYQECECFPRKFILDVSEAVSNMDSLKHAPGNSAGNINACIVFVLDVDNEVNNAMEHVYKISVNTNFSSGKETVKIETMFDYMETTVDEVIQRTVFYLDTLPVDSLAVEKAAPSYNYRLRKSYSCLEEIASWKSHSYRPNSTYLYHSFVGQNDASSQGFDVVSHFESYDNNVGISSPKDAFCGVCYESLAGRSGTALTSCKHWFCDECWTEHLETRVRGGATTLVCPEYDCDKCVEPATALTLLNMRDVIKFTRICHDNKVEEKSVTKWCPNKTCGRVIEVNSSEAKVARCECGREMCFQCFGLPHWPAACASMTKYYKTLKETGDVGLVPEEFDNPIVVNGKPCPHCGRFVEKKGGCPYMVCACRKTFCWGCGKDYAENTHDASCNKGGYGGDTYKTEMKEFKHNRSSRGRRRWYKVALSHRLDQHPLKIAAMRSKMTGICKKLSIFVLRRAQLGNPVSIDFEVSGRTFSHEEDKIPKLLTSMILLHTEVHQLIENTAVLLDSDTLNKSTDACLRNAIRRLTTFSNATYELFMNGSATAPDELLKKIVDVRRRSRQAIQCLIKCVSASSS